MAYSCPHRDPFLSGRWGCSLDSGGGHRPAAAADPAPAATIAGRSDPPSSVDCSPNTPGVHPTPVVAQSRWSLKGLGGTGTPFCVLADLSGDSFRWGVSISVIIPQSRGQKLSNDCPSPSAREQGEGSLIAVKKCAPNLSNSTDGQIIFTTLRGGFQAPLKIRQCHMTI